MIARLLCHFLGHKRRRRMILDGHPVLVCPRCEATAPAKPKQATLPLSKVA